VDNLFPTIKNKQWESTSTGGPADNQFQNQTFNHKISAYDTFVLSLHEINSAYTLVMHYELCIKNFKIYPA